MKEETKQPIRPQAKGKPDARAGKARPNIQFKPKNWILLAAGIVTIIAGYILLAQGSITFAPLLLVAGYCVLVPIGILIK